MAEKVIFDDYLYDQEAVEAAAEAYGHLVDINVERDGEQMTVTLDNIPEEHAGVLKDAFCNHALYETIVRFRSEAGEGVL